MDSSIREWLNLSVRWIHVFAAIMWVGQTYYFTWLDGQFAKLEKKARVDGTAPAVWLVHSGGIDALGQRTRRIHSHGSDLRHHHGSECVVLHSPNAAQDARGCGSGRKVRCVARRASEVAFEAQHVPGRAGCLSDAEQSFSRCDLREPVRLGNHAGAGCGGMDCSETNPRVLIRATVC